MITVDGVEYRPCWHTGILMKGYFVSEEGRVWSVKNKKHIKAFVSGNTPYERVGLSLAGKQYTCQVHQLVAFAWIPRPTPECPVGFPESDWELLSENGKLFLDHRNLQVDHIDGDKTNNHRNNLRWLTGEINRAIAMKQKETLAKQQKAIANASYDGSSNKTGLEHFFGETV